MNKYLLTILFIFIFIGNIYAAAPNRTYNYVSQATINPDENNANENALYSYVQTGVDTYKALSISDAAISNTAAIAYTKLNLTGSVAKTDLASSVTNFLLPSGAVFFMATGSCPSGTTDISATYANKYVKINATQLTSTGVVLTGTTDSHVITQAELPNVSLSLQVDGSTVGTKSAGGDGPNFGSSANGGNSHTATALLGGSATGHTHTISSATTLEPSSITMKACQVS